LYRRWYFMNSAVVSLTDQLGAAKLLPPPPIRPRILVSGACRGIGLRCAEALSARGAELLLCDIDGERLVDVADRLGAAAHYRCDVASEANVGHLTERLSGQFQSLDMLINAAGGGYARTLGMYRMSRALMPALRQGMHKLLVNAPPSGRDADVPAFPYASSRLAFHRLSSALAFEARGAPIHVWIACASRRRLVPVTPDPNAGSWADSCDAGGASDEDIETMARQVASLLDEQKAARRHAG